MNPLLLEAFARLDERLREVIAAEARRAAQLAPRDGSAGWEGLADMTRAPVEALIFDPEIGTDNLMIAEQSAPLLATRLGLSALAVDALFVAFAPHVDARYRTLFDVLGEQPSHGRVTPRLLLIILGREPERARALRLLLRTEGTLRATGLLRADGPEGGPLAQPLALDNAVVDLFLDHPLPAAISGLSLRAVPGEGSHQALPTVAISGPGDTDPVLDRLAPGASRLHIAPDSDPHRLLAAAHALLRVAACRGAWPIVDLRGLDSLAARRVGESLHVHVLRFGTPLVLRTHDPAPWPIVGIHAPRPSWQARREAWRSEAARQGSMLSDDDAGFLATATRMRPSLLPAVFAAAPSHTPTDLAAEAARISSQNLPHGTLIRPARTFEDLVLASTTRQALQRLLHYVRHRDRLSEKRKLEHRFRMQRGPIALFSGLPGTGKTLSAEVVAQALGRPLHVVDLSRLVSKFIGETEKHINEVLTAGERAGAVLLFDEADALFAKRTEVSSSNDRFANLEVGYLLQRIEHHDGLVILSTNLQRSVDDAFLRRFHSRIEFPLPSAEHRARLWQLMLPPGVPRAEDLDLARLAHAHRLSGGEIRNAALKAIFMAEQQDTAVDEAVLGQAVAVELLELGRLSRRTADGADLGTLALKVVQALAERVEAHLSTTFLKEIHVVHGPPTREAISGKHPAASLAVYQLVQARSGTLKLGMVLSAWCARPEEEQELLGVLHETLAGVQMPPVCGQPVTTRVAESFDFDLLHRFWSSHGQPVRASVVLDVVVGESGRRGR